MHVSLRETFTFQRSHISSISALSSYRQVCDLPSLFARQHPHYELLCWPHPNRLATLPWSRTQSYAVCPITAAFEGVFLISIKSPLKINYCIQHGLSTFALSNHQLVRTRVSIHLDKASTQLSVIPVDWDIIVEHPDAEYVDNDHYWSMFVREAIWAMAPGVLCCIWRPSFPDIISNSTYKDDLMCFYGHILLSERRRRCARYQLSLPEGCAETFG